MENKTYEIEYQKLMDDPSVSFLFKEMLQKYDKRDPVDALNEAELLVDAMKMKLGCINPGFRKFF